MQGNYIFQLGSNLISGNVFFDFNGNGFKDAGEVPLKNAVLSLSPSQGFALTDNFGNYNMYCGTGINNVGILNLPAYFLANPVNRLPLHSPEPGKQV